MAFKCNADQINQAYQSSSAVPLSRARGSSDTSHSASNDDDEAKQKEQHVACAIVFYLLIRPGTISRGLAGASVAPTGRPSVSQSAIQSAGQLGQSLTLAGLVSVVSGPPQTIKILSPRVRCISRIGLLDLAFSLTRRACTSSSRSRHTHTHILWPPMI